MNPATVSLALDAALALRQRGLSVFPLQPRGKMPRVPWTPYQLALPTEEEIHTWWRDCSDANIGIVTGAVSGLVVVDLDGPAGQAAFAERCGGVLPDTPMVRTGRGLHLYFAHPGGRVPNSVRVLPQVDVRGDGGMVVAPPSVHSSGAVYEWVASLDTPLAPLPGWVLTATAVSGRPALAGNIVGNGQRNEYLYRLGRSLHAKGLSPEAIQAALTEENASRCQPPLDGREMDGLIEHVVAQADRPDFDVPSTVAETAAAPRTPGLFAPMTARDFLAVEPAPIVWVWEPYLPTGTLTVFSAYMKTGKSTFIAPMMLAVAQGRPFLGMPTKQTPVLALAVEEHPRDVKARLGSLGLRPDDPFHIVSGWLSRDEWPRVVAYVREHGIGLVVLDTLSAYWGVEDENDNAEVHRLVQPFHTLARNTGASVVLVHHDRKSGGRDGRNIRGGSALFGLVDQALSLERPQGGAETRRILKSIGRYADTPREVVLDYLEGQYVLADGPIGGHTDGAMEVLRGALSSPQTMRDLERVTGLSRNVLRRLLGDLGAEVVREGLGTKADPYTYWLG
jgi:hypothetical protein